VKTNGGARKKKKKKKKRTSTMEMEFSQAVKRLHLGGKCKETMMHDGATKMTL
jgi:hypothetical protein